MRMLNLIVAERMVETERDSMLVYAQTIENLLLTETARLSTIEYLRDLRTRVTAPETEPAEPSDELFLLRDEFPSMLRATMLPVVHGLAERTVRNIVNAAVPKEMKLERGANAKAICDAIESSFHHWFLTSEQPVRLKDYMHLRHAFAHGGPRIGRHLRDVRRVAKAAERVPGIKLSHMVDDPKEPGLTADQRWAGNLVLSAEFIPTAIAFHCDLVDQFIRFAKDLAK